MSMRNEKQFQKDQKLEEQFQEIQTKDDFNKFFGKEHSGSCIHFPVKINYVLRFVKKHPELMEEVGASWCSDEKYFISNSQILCKILDINSNTLNSDFRHYKFEKEMDNKKVLFKFFFPNLINIGGWQIRRCKNFNFTSNLTNSELERIKSIKYKNEHLTNNNTNDDFIPTETRELLSSDQSQIAYISSLYYSMSDKEFFIDLLNYVTLLWKQTISTEPFADINRITSIILNVNFDDENIEIDKKYYILKYNIEELMNEGKENSQVSDFVTFYNFLKFFILFSDKFDLSSTIREISYIPDPINEIESSFYNWFQVSKSDNLAAKTLKKQENYMWIIKPSKTPDQFKLFLKKFDEPIQIIYVRINHNPMADDPTKKFSVMFDDGKIYGQSLDDILSNILCLNKSLINMDFVFHADMMKQVNGEQIANRVELQNENIYGDLFYSQYNIFCDCNEDYIDFGKL